MGAVEGHNLARHGVMFANAPQKVVLQLLLCRLTKADSFGALRVKDRKDITDGAAFAGGVHSLQNYEQGRSAFFVGAAIGKETLLKVVKLFIVMPETIS